MTHPVTSEREDRSRLTRRGLLALGLTGAAAGGIFAARWFNIFAVNDATDLTPVEAQIAAGKGEILLVDIRRPDEWASTGVPEGAIPLDMRREDFTQALAAYSDADKSRPVALICARGVRSSALIERLRSAGFTNVKNVPEGMLGSGAGPGWIKRGLPVSRHP